MNQVGALIRAQRLKLGLLQQDVAAKLDMDAPMLSKIEKGLRQLKRNQILKIARIIQKEEEEVLALWLADQIISLINNETIAIKVLKLVDKKIKPKVKRN